ncbi:hypothetical protein QJQ45_029596, partial [Haematococcus lacustris]
DPPGIRSEAINPALTATRGFLTPCVLLQCWWYPNDVYDLFVLNFCQTCGVPAINKLVTLWQPYSSTPSTPGSSQHIITTLATWDTVCEVCLHPKWARQRLMLNAAHDQALQQLSTKHAVMQCAHHAKKSQCNSKEMQHHAASWTPGMQVRATGSKDYSPSSSPYSLSLVSTVATTDNVTAVFRVNALPLSPSPSICYQTLLNNGIEKIEVASQLACLRNVRVLIDGLPSSASGVALPANYRTVANIKVKFSSLAGAVFDDDGGPCVGLRSQLTITALAGQAYTVVVEGWASRADGFNAEKLVTLWQPYSSTPSTPGSSQHIITTLATWDTVCEVCLHPKWARQRLMLNAAHDQALQQLSTKHAVMQCAHHAKKSQCNSKEMQHHAASWTPGMQVRATGSKDYSPSSSPYSLSLISTVATADNVTAVFRVNALPLFPSPSICYQTLLNNGIEKIEIASRTATTLLPVHQLSQLHCCLAAGSCSNPQVINVGIGNTVWAPDVTTCTPDAVSSWSCRAAKDYTYQLAAASFDRRITVSTCVRNVVPWDTFLFAFPMQGSSCPTCPVRHWLGGVASWLWVTVMVARRLGGVHIKAVGVGEGVCRSHCHQSGHIRQQLQAHWPTHTTHTLKETVFLC